MRGDSAGETNRIAMACDSTVILHFCTKYFTAWGENVVICGNTPALGDDNVELYEIACSCIDNHVDCSVSKDW